MEETMVNSQPTETTEGYESTDVWDVDVDSIISEVNSIIDDGNDTIELNDEQTETPTTEPKPEDEPAATEPETDAEGEAAETAAEPDTQPEPTPEPITNPLNGEITDVPVTARPYAVMINNISEAQPQCGVAQADIVYEILAEGGITRMLAIFSDIADAGPIGSMRSARRADACP